MNEQVKELEELSNGVQQVVENSDSVDNASETVSMSDAPTAKKRKLSKKIVVAIGVGIIAIVAIVFLAIRPSEFEKVKSECVHIAGGVTGSDDYFKLDTYPDEYKNMDSTLVSMLAPEEEENVLKAIKYANEALGFNGSLYSKMLDTTALMGRQSEENDKYKVSWTYHPDDGLEVTYEKK